jgi:hypothetical protein
MSQFFIESGGGGPPPIIIPNYTLVTFSMVGFNYNVLATDYYISVIATNSGNIILPAAPANGTQLIIKDRNGLASTKNITIQGNGNTIDLAASYVLAGNFDSVQLLYENGNWEIF